MEQSPSYPSKAEIARRKAQQRRLSETLGIELPEIGTESEAPPVDEAEIRGFVEKRLSTDAQRRVAGPDLAIPFLGSGLLRDPPME